MSVSRKASFTGGVVLTLALVLGGCSNGSGTDSSSSSSSSQASSSSASASSQTTASDAPSADAQLALSEGVVRASSADNPMTAVFGDLVNNSDEEVHITGLKASVDAEKCEIHETVDGKMREKPGGIIIPAGGTYTLKPGGDHLMIMGLAKPVEAGEMVDITLDLDGKGTAEIKDIPVRSIAAGNESYGDDGEVKENSGVDTEHSHH